MMLDVYKDFAENYMAIPVVPGVKSESEKFAGALRTYSIEAMMQDGKALQFATSHNLGQNFAKVFDVQFLDENNTQQYVWQTSWGLSTRTIGGLIMVHSDDKGLVLPPKIASIQVIITTVGVKEDNKNMLDIKAKELCDELSTAGILTEVDTSDSRPGEKFYEWEKKGVPLRIELGPKDIANNSVTLARRDNGEKSSVALTDLKDQVAKILDRIQQNLYQKALDLRLSRTKSVNTWEDFIKEIKSNNFVMAHWSGDADVEAKIKEETGATIRCIPFDQPEEEGVCIYSGKPSKKRVLFASAY
jgi:prolyl-tRNA synthetase